MTTTAHEILALETGFWTHANDPRYFEENLAEEAITVIEPMGFIDKDHAVHATAKKPWTHVQMADVELRELTADCVILAYHGKGSMEGVTDPYRGSIASTYVRRDGRWQLALTAHQPWVPDAERDR